MGLLAGGQTVGEIAARLGLGESTVSTFIGRAAAKVGGRTVPHALALLLTLRAIPAPDPSGPLPIRQAIKVEAAKSRRR